MTRMFGDAWVHRYGESDDGMWAAVLESLSPKAVQAGLRSCLFHWTNNWPPTPAQFYELCLDAVRGQQTPYQRLEQKAAQSEVAERELKRMRESLGMSATRHLASEEYGERDE